LRTLDAGNLFVRAGVEASREPEFCRGPHSHDS
jgi:hypothetical protein